MKNRKNHFRMYASLLIALLCIFLPLALAACGDSEETASSASSVEETPEAPKTDADKFLDALNAYDAYFNNISDDFGTKLPDVSDRGTMDLQMTVPVFSVFGESQADVFDPDQPILQATVVRAGDLSSTAISTLLYGEQMRMETYRSATEGYLVFPDLPEQASIRLTAEEVENGVSNVEDAFKKQLDALGDAGEDAASYLTVTEDGDTCHYFLRLTAKRVFDLLKDMGFDTSDTDTLTDDDYMVYDLTTVGGLPTELRIGAYGAGETGSSAEFVLKTSATGSNTKINAELSENGETILTANAAITSAQGVITVNAALEMGDAKLTANVKLLSESETSIMLDGTAEARFNMEGDAAITLPMNVTGKISADGDARKAELELNSSSTGMFDITLRFQASFTPGETSVTLPEGAVDYAEVDTEALQEALREAYPQIFGEPLGGDDDFDWGDIGGTGYMSEDENIFVSVYEDDTIYFFALAVECVDNGKSLTLSYNGKSLGSYDYTVPEDDIVEICGMQMYVEELGDGWIEFYFEDEANEFIWVTLQFVGDDVVIDFCLPFETVDGVTKILLPDGTALPFDVIIPEDEISPLQIGSLTLLRYVDSVPV